MPHRPRTAICQFCKQPFIYRCRRQITQIHCSKYCYHQTRLINAFAPCKNCGKPVKKKKGRLYCSDKCLNTFVYGDKKQIKCNFCEKTFEIHQSANPKFCSLQCKYKADEIRITVYCSYCKKPRTGAPHKVKKLVFCSTSCVRKAKAETAPEKRVRLALEKLKIEYIAQYPIGRYHIDFFLLFHGIALEVDGNYWHELRKSSKKDAIRDRSLSAMGVKTVRLVVTDSRKFVRSNIEQLINSKLDEVST